MRKTRPFYRSLLVSISLATIFAANAWAQDMNWRTTRQVRTVVNRLITSTNTFRNEIQRNRYPWDANANVEERLSNQTSALYNALTSLRSSLGNNSNTTDELNGVLSRASRINMLLERNTVSSRAQTQWTRIRSDVNTLAGYYNVAWNWNEPYNPNGGGGNTGSTYQTRAVVDRLITEASAFQREIQRNRYPWDNNADAETRLSNQASALTNSLTALRTDLNANRSTTDELNRVLAHASRISMLLDRNQVSTRTQSEWNTMRSDLSTLAGYYNVAWNWNEPYNPNGTGTGWGGGGYGNRSLTGTYRLNTTMSDNISTVVDRNVGYYSTDQRDRMRRMLERRLTAPDMIAIDRNGRTITMASSIQQQVTFEADGVSHTETNPRGRTVTTTVTSDRNGFSVKTTGDRGNDFTATFENDVNGRLRVTRQIYLENRNQTVSSTSIYDRIDDTANWSAIVPQTTGPWFNNVGGTVNNTGQFYVPNGVTLTARLRDSINTRTTQVGDRFTMEVISPNDFRNSVIEGHVSQASNSGRFSGRANLQLDFDTITVNGRQYAFAGLIDSVSLANGDSITVNNEGTIRDNSRTTQTVTRAGIGALLGAVIGAIAGGGQGAAIGAGVGAGAGAGSVLVGGRDHIDLGPGSTFMITASAPANAAYVPRD